MRRTNIVALLSFDIPGTFLGSSLCLCSNFPLLSLTSWKWALVVSCCVLITQKIYLVSSYPSNMTLRFILLRMDFLCSGLIFSLSSSTRTSIPGLSLAAVGIKLEMEWRRDGSETFVFLEEIKLIHTLLMDHFATYHYGNSVFCWLVFCLWHGIISNIKVFLWLLQ